MAYGNMLTHGYRHRHTCTNAGADDAPCASCPPHAPCRYLCCQGSNDAAAEPQDRPSRNSHPSRPRVPSGGALGEPPPDSLSGPISPPSPPVPPTTHSPAVPGVRASPGAGRPDSSPPSPAPYHHAAPANPSDAATSGPSPRRRGGIVPPRPGSRPPSSVAVVPPRANYASPHGENRPTGPLDEDFQDAHNDDTQYE